MHLSFFSVLGCPIVKKRKLEEAEAGENQSASKRRNQPAKQADEDSDTAEEEEQKEDEGEGKDANQDKKKNNAKSRIELIKCELTQKKGQTSITTHHHDKLEVLCFSY